MEEHDGGDLSASIELKNTNHVFYAGEPILGSLHICVQKGNQFTLHDIAIKWKCDVVTVVPGIKNRDGSLQGKGVVNYLRSSRHTLPQGVSTYSFLLFLPHDIPQSLTLNHGLVSYILKVRIKFMEFPSYLQARTTFNVRKNLVLRYDQKVPLTIPIRKEVFDGGAIIGSLRISSGEFITKDDLQYQIRLQNRSGRGIRRISLKLIQEFTYKPTSDEGSRTTESISLWRKDLPGTLPFGEVHLSKRHPRIFEGLSPSNALESAELIETSYFLTLKLRSYLRTTVLYLKIPLIIGTSLTYDTQSLIPYKK